MLVKRIQPRRTMVRLEVVGILVRILLLHRLEAGNIEVWQVLAVLARSEREAIVFCHDDTAAIKD